MIGEHEMWMRLAIEEATLARGSTGDNPWVGCVIVSPHGELVGRGHTLGPGEDHAEIAAARDAQARGQSVAGATLYSTLEPCAFHGRTPACARSIADRGIARVVTGMRDPHPRVNGAGTQILRDAGVEVIEGVCEAEVRRQLGAWVLEQHPEEPLQRARTLPEPDRATRLAEVYGVERSRIEALLEEKGTVSEMAFELSRGVAVLERTPRAIRALLDGLPPEWTEATEGPDTWSPYVVVGHLIHGERTDWIPRAEIILGQGQERRFTPYDRFAQFRESEGKLLGELLDEFARLRAGNVQTLAGWQLSDKELALTGEHPEFGAVTLRQLLATWVAHDLGHLAQIARVMAKQYRGAVGPWRAYLSIMER